MPGLGAKIESKDNLTFEGNLLLKFKVVRENTSEIELNALKLEFGTHDLEKFELKSESSSLTGPKTAKLEPKLTEIKMDEARQKVFATHYLHSIKIQLNKFFRLRYSLNWMAHWKRKVHTYLRFLNDLFFKITFVLDPI